VRQQDQAAEHHDRHPYPPLSLTVIAPQQQHQHDFEKERAEPSGIQQDVVRRLDRNRGVDEALPWLWTVRLPSLCQEGDGTSDQHASEIADMAITVRWLELERLARQRGEQYRKTGADTTDTRRVCTGAAPGGRRRCVAYVST
jgi:hypothetical protein